nr:MAG TPA: hypothetical protein [Caudoviricetes sp.]
MFIRGLVNTFISDSVSIFVLATIRVIRYCHCIT